MLARECVPENAGVAGYAEAFRGVLSGKQASIQSSYLRTAILGLFFFLQKFLTGRKDHFSFPISSTAFFASSLSAAPESAFKSLSAAFSSLSYFSRETI